MKRLEIKRRPLADTVLSSLEPEPKEYRESYGVDGLYFVVSPSGRKRWELRHKKPNGKWSFMGMGGYPEVSAKRAREKASAALAHVEAGHDPVAHKAATRQAESIALANTFEASAEEWFHSKTLGSLSSDTLDKIRTYLDKDILPAIGHMAINEVTRGDCAAIQARIEARKAFNVAKKVRGWLNKIFARAIARGVCENNPASELLALAAEAPPTTHYPHLLEPELPSFVNALRRSHSRLTTRTAAWLVLWSASRPGMVRLAEWTEIDLDQARWVIPAPKMKSRRAHIVPLPTQAVAALRELHRLTGRSKWVFPGIGPKNPTISENTINSVIAKVGYKGKLVGHGARHTASTLLREHGWHKDFVEAQLAHKEEGTSGIYNQAKYIKARAHMMQWYADYLDALADGMTTKLIASFGRTVQRQ